MVLNIQKAPAIQSELLELLSNIRRRQAEGIAAAKARGVRFGQQEHPLPDDFPLWFYRWRRGEIAAQELSDHCGLHISTIYRKAKKMGLPL